MNSNSYFPDSSTLAFSIHNLNVNDTFRKKIFYLKADIPLTDHILTAQLNKKKSDKKKGIKAVISHVFKNEKVKIKAIPDSTLHDVYNIFLNKNEYILKISKFNTLYHETQFLQEYHINKLLKQNSLHALNIISVDISRKYFPIDFIMMEKGKGKLLHNWKLTKQKEKKIFINLGEMIAKIHTIPIEKYGPLSITKLIKVNKRVGLFNTWEEFFKLNLDNHIKLCFRNNAISQLEKKQIEKIFLKNTDLLKKIKPSLLHNDLSARNMFVDKENKITLIDWEDSISGDPIYDIASFGTFCYLPQHSDREKYFREGYEKVMNLPKDFEKRYWIYYLRIAILKTALLARQGNNDKLKSQRIQSALKELI